MSIRKTSKNGCRVDLGADIGKVIRTEPTKRSKTGIRGVYKTGNDKQGYCYQARITVNGKEKILYCGYDLNKAIKAREYAEEEYYKPIIEKAIKLGYLEEVI